MMYGYGYGWTWGGALFMVLNMLFWAALIGLLIWAIFRWASGRGGIADGGRDLSPREILDQRYARGEIDEETYDRMLARLEGRVPGPPAGVR